LVLGQKKLLGGIKVEESKPNLEKKQVAVLQCNFYGQVLTVDSNL